jgi:hypothetical protein
MILLKQVKEEKANNRYICCNPLEKKPSLGEGEDDGASSEKQSAFREKHTQNFDVLDHQEVEVSSMNKPSSMSMVEKSIIQPTLTLI